MTLISKLRVAAGQSVLWTLMLPIRIPVECGAFLINKVIGSPHGDCERDRAAEDVFAASAVGRKASGFVTTSGRAWRDSATHRLVGQALRPFSDAFAAEQMRLAALVTIVASLTALALRYAAYAPAPLTWVVPMLAVIVGAVMLVVAKRN